MARKVKIGLKQMFIIKESKNKDWFIDFIKNQINIDLSNRVTDSKKQRFGESGYHKFR